MAYFVLIAIPAIIVAVTLVVTRYLCKRRTELTTTNPVDNRYNRRLWSKASKNCKLTSWLREREATMLLRWPGISLDDIITSYDTKCRRYNTVMTPSAQAALDAWKSENPKIFQDLDKEPWGLQVRLERVQFDHREHKYTIGLSPIKYLYYLSLQARLWDSNLANLRKEVFWNAMSFLTEGFTPLLPNHFALHMAIVSQDKKLLIRKRPDDTKLYPGVWEASIGEFMHGPEHQHYTHFNSDLKPDLRMFCINAVAEETNYKKAVSSEFLVYGFGIEYRTLAPKMYVIYQSSEMMEYLLSQGQPDDRGKELSSIELTPRSLGEALSPSSDYLWSPSSKIISLLALLESAVNNRDRKSLKDDFMMSYGAKV